MDDWTFPCSISFINKLKFDFALNTDASESGWGATNQESSTKRFWSA